MEGLATFFKSKGVFEEVGLDLSDPKNVILTMSGAFSDIDRDGDIDLSRVTGLMGHLIQAS